ncbi:MAG: PKD domain-containing protein [Methanomassiliicoccales archaeon]|nr:MAG: PKD domain-containing protein [Methanomassiliicoccales archaeon]
MMGILLLGSAIIVVADQPPVADADPDHQTVAVGEEAWFSGSASYDPDGYIVSYYWIFGDGLCYEGESMTYTFNAVGNFTVSLTVIDDFDNQDTDYVTVNVVEEPPSEPLMAWIESLETDKEDYYVNETVLTQVTVQRSNDMLTYVWEGTLILEVLDDASMIVFTDERPVYLPHGGATETHDFEFVLSALGDYLVRAMLYDFYDELVDIKEICITVCDDNSGGNGTKPPNDEDKFVWIESLTTDKELYDVNEVVNTQVVVKRGDDLLDYVWEGILILEVFDEVMVLIYSEEQDVFIPCGGWIQTLNFEYTLTEPGDYLVRATLYDIHDELMDIKEICITVVDDETPPPNEEDKFVWIESLTTDKDVYEVNEVVNTQVIVQRGNDMLTYVWEGTLILEVLDDASVIVFTDERPVYLPHGGATETHDFEFVLTESGKYLVRATLYDMNMYQIDIKENSITVCQGPNDGDGTVPPDDGETEPSGDNRWDFFTSDKSGVFGLTSSGQATLIALIFAVFLFLSAFATVRYTKKLRNKE